MDTFVDQGYMQHAVKENPGFYVYLSLTHAQEYVFLKDKHRKNQITVSCH